MAPNLNEIMVAPSVDADLEVVITVDEILIPKTIDRDFYLFIRLFVLLLCCRLFMYLYIYSPSVIYLSGTMNICSFTCRMKKPTALHRIVI